MPSANLAERAGCRGLSCGSTSVGLEGSEVVGMRSGVSHTGKLGEARRVESRACSVVVLAAISCLSRAASGDASAYVLAAIQAHEAMEQLNLLQKGIPFRRRIR